MTSGIAITPRSGSEGSTLLDVSMGPHHPSTHGVFRMDVKLDGETIVALKPVFGYLHRNHEKIAESSSYLGCHPLHRPARLHLPAHQQPGVLSWRWKNSPASSTRTRRIHPGDCRRTHPSHQSQFVCAGFFRPGLRRVRPPVMCLPRTGKSARSLRVAPPARA